MNNQSSKRIDNCHTCWPSIDPITGKNVIKCVNTVSAKKVVRTYMHPTDDIGYTLFLFQAKIKCFSNYTIPRKYDEYKLLKSYSEDNNVKYSKIQYENLPYYYD